MSSSFKSKWCGATSQVTLIPCCFAKRTSSTLSTVAVGLGTIVAEGKQIINVDGKDYLLEKPLRADVALLGASLADRSGNLVYKGTSQNFNPLMATAADLVIAEVRELVETGAIAPEAVRTPGIFVDYMVAPAK